MSLFLNIVFAGLTAAALAGPLQPGGESPQPDAGSSPFVVISVEFAGGTIAEYVQAVRDAAGGANIVVMPEAADIALPPIQLTSVRLRGALELIQGQFQRRDARSVVVGLTQIHPAGEFDEGVFRVSADIVGPSQRGSRRSHPPVVHVWTMSGLLARGMQPEDVLAAVETTLDLFVGEREPVQIRFHEPTGVLIASGEDLQLTAIDQVLERLSEGLSERRWAEQEAQEEPLEQAQKEIELLRHELLALRGEIERSATRMRELEILASDRAGR